MVDVCKIADHKIKEYNYLLVKLFRHLSLVVHIISLSVQTLIICSQVVVALNSSPI